MTDHRRLPIARPDAPGNLARHPDDGWVRAEPYPMGRSTLHACRTLIDVLLPDREGAPYEAGIEDLVLEQLRVMLAYMPALVARGVILTFHLLHWSPLWRFRGLLPLSRVSREKGRSVLRGIAQSRVLSVRLLLQGPQGLILSTYFDQDFVHRALDYDPASFTRGRIALRKRLLAGEAATPDDNIPLSEGLSS